MSFTKVMGTIALEENDTRSIEDLVLLANSYVKAGAELLEIGAKACLLYTSDAADELMRV